MNLRGSLGATAAAFALRIGGRCAKSGTEKSTAESIARKVSGVKSVRNEIAVRP